MKLISLASSAIFLCGLAGLAIAQDQGNPSYAPTYAKAKMVDAPGNLGTLAAGDDRSCRISDADQNSPEVGNLKFGAFDKSTKTLAQQDRRESAAFAPLHQQAPKPQSATLNIRREEVIADTPESPKAERNLTNNDFQTKEATRQVAFRPAADQDDPASNKVEIGSETQPADEVDEASAEENTADEETANTDEPDLDPQADDEQQKAEISDEEQTAQDEKDAASETASTKEEQSNETKTANVSPEQSDAQAAKDEQEESASKEPAAEPEKSGEDAKEDEAETASEPEGPSDPVAAKIVELLKKSGKGKETKALTEFYNQPDRTPLWVSDTGLSDAGKAVRDEIQRADDYGLKATAFKLPNLSGESADETARAKAEIQMARAILKYARHAKGGRVTAKQLGSQLDKDPKLLPANDVIDSISQTDDPATYLRSLHPLHPQFVKLRGKLLELRKGKGGSGPKIPSGPVLKRGVVHEQVALLRKRLSVEEEAANENEFDESVEKAVKSFQSQKGITPDGVVGNGTRKVMNGVTGGRQINKILLNMERWRWLPENLYGDAGIYVWSNIPEYWVRVMKDDVPIFSDRTIVGLLTHKTPIFSDEMEWVEIHPTWYVPNSIKVADILPSLKRPTSTVMQRYNLKLDCGAHGSDPKSIDWSSVNITKCRVTQPPGPKSVLGDFKFKFPNKHSVYMHDTHKPELFKAGQRTFSHGCMRIHNPRKFAETLLVEENVMSAERLTQILKGPQKEHRAKFEHHVPVHITYFTMVFNDEGELVSRPDVYGHDATLSRVLNSGSSSRAPEPAVAASTEDVKKKKPKKKKTAQQESNWWDDLLNPN